MLNRFRHCGRKSGMTILFLLVYCFSSLLSANNISQKGHIKYQALLASYPDDSLFQDFTDDPSFDQNADLRFNISHSRANWSWQVDYQLLAKHGDSVALSQQQPATSLTSQIIANDDNRLIDLTSTISEGDQSISVHRFDRLHLTYTSEQTVFRLGRQTLSWGNGLVYNPMDFFNPFDPAAVDKEYKTGDDMLYGQHLFDDGNDLQAVWVGRRNDDGDIDNSVFSVATKYHVFLDDYELDFLLAEHFDEQVIGIGGVANVGGSVWRSDIISTEVNNEWYNSVVLNASYSWLAGGKNMSGMVEYFRNGFGIDDGDYAPANLAQKPELTSRILRGELFTLGQNNLSASATIELTPLWLLTSTIFSNLDDHSVLLQIISQHDLMQNLQLLIAVNFPDGDDGTEFGGIDSGLADRPLSVDESLFVQLAYYF